MDLLVGIHIPILIIFALCSGFSSGQLFLQPQKEKYGYFTGESFFVTCFTSNGNVADLSWKDVVDEAIEAGEISRVHTQSANEAQQGLRLVFTTVKSEDAGTYTCTDNDKSVSFELTVYRSISFGETANEQHAAEGETGIINCHVMADNNLRAVVNWYYNGSKILETDKYDIMDSHNLRIHNLSRNDAGKYKCSGFVSTPLASQMKDFVISFLVQYVPEIVGDKHVITYASIGSDKRLSCLAVAQPRPIFEWLSDEMIIHNNTEGYQIFNTDNSSILHITSVSDSHLVEYVCRASNALGQKEVYITLKEGETPRPPQLSVIDEKQGELKLGIKVQEDDDADEELKVTGFKVEYILAAETWDMANSQEFELGGPYLLKNMSFNTDYILRAAARNAAGYGQSSDEVTYKTESLRVASVIASASGMVASSLVLVVSIVFFRLF